MPNPGCPVHMPAAASGPRLREQAVGEEVEVRAARAVCKLYRQALRCASGLYWVTHQPTMPMMTSTMIPTVT